MELAVIDEVNFVFEGIFSKIVERDGCETIIDNIYHAVDVYKINFVDEGLALGKFSDSMLLMPEYEYEDDEVFVGNELSYEEAGFVITNIWFDEPTMTIKGQLCLLQDTEPGIKAIEFFKSGVNLYISKTNHNDTVWKDEELGTFYYDYISIENFELSPMKYF